MMIIDTRYFSDGQVYAKLWKDEEKAVEREPSDRYERYIDKIGIGGDYETVYDWASDIMFHATKQEIKEITEILENYKTALCVTKYI